MCQLAGLATTGFLYNIMQYIYTKNVILILPYELFVSFVSRANKQPDKTYHG